MSKLIEHNAATTNDPDFWELLKTRGLAVIKIIAIIFAIYVLARLIAVPIAYEYFVGYLVSDFGLQDVYARPFAIALTALAVAATPTLLLATLFGYRAKQVFVWILGASIIVALSTYLFTGDVYFDRTTGTPQKCYAKTLEGFKFSSTCDFDPKLGVRFQKITPDVMKEIVFWQKNGKLKDIPSVKDGQYFDPLTGESIVWYSLRSDGSIELSPLPGFSTSTGETLKPVTKDVIKEYSLDVGGNAAIINTYKNGSLLTDIELALAEGYGQYGSTETSQRALENIWKWYFAQKNTPEARSSSAKLDYHHRETWLSDAFDTSGPTVKVDKVINVKPYVLIIVSFSAGAESVKTDEEISILDKDAHDVHFISRPELPGIKSKTDKPPSDKNPDSLVKFTLNPYETIRVMYFLKGLGIEQVGTGYVQFEGVYTVEYSNAI